MDKRLEILNKYIDFSKDGVIEREQIVKAMQEYADLQLQQTGVNGSFFKCTCLRPQPNCFSGLCTYCNRTIEKNITTDDLKPTPNDIGKIIDDNLMDMI